MKMNLSKNDPSIVKIKQLLKEGRSAYEKASNIEDEIFIILDVLGISDPSLIPTHAENANSLLEAITCYMQYNEYSVDGIIEEIKSIIS